MQLGGPEKSSVFHKGGGKRDEGERNIPSQVGSCRGLHTARVFCGLLVPHWHGGCCPGQLSVTIPPSKDKALEQKSLANAKHHKPCRETAFIAYCNFSHTHTDLTVSHSAGTKSFSLSLYISLGYFIFIAPTHTKVLTNACLVSMK